MLNVQHRRGGEAIPYRWGFWHLWAFETAVKADGGNVFTTGHHRFTTRVVVVDELDGEEVHCMPGDTVEMWR